VRPLARGWHGTRTCGKLACPGWSCAQAPVEGTQTVGNVTQHTAQHNRKQHVRKQRSRTSPSAHTGTAGLHAAARAGPSVTGYARSRGRRGRGKPAPVQMWTVKTRHVFGRMWGGGSRVLAACRPCTSHVVMSLVLTVQRIATCRSMQRHGMTCKLVAPCDEYAST
jgi:hypothetical protein